MKDSPSTHKATIIKVLDADTLLVDFMGKTDEVRLIGVDAPETLLTDKSQRDSMWHGQEPSSLIEQGKRAASFVRMIVRPQDVVSLEFDFQRRDKFGRLLSYVYLRDGTMLNQLLLKTGHATIMTVPPNVKHKDLFLKLHRINLDLT